jgi:hypothetical protein
MSKKTGPFYITFHKLMPRNVEVSSGPAPRCTMCLTPAFWHYPITLYFGEASTVYPVIIKTRSMFLKAGYAYFHHQNLE